jgi:hypothetical protein
MMSPLVHKFSFMPYLFNGFQYHKDKRQFQRLLQIFVCGTFGSLRHLTQFRYVKKLHIVQNIRTTILIVMNVNMILHPSFFLHCMLADNTPPKHLNEFLKKTLCIKKGMFINRREGSNYK